MSSTRSGATTRARRPHHRVVAVVGGTALLAAVTPALADGLSTRGDAPAAPAASSASAGPAAVQPSRPQTARDLGAAAHIEVSSTDWQDPTAAGVRLARDPGDALDALAAESPWIGPAGTPTGVARCLDTLPDGTLDGVTTVSVDLAVRSGEPVTGLVLTGGTGRRAVVVPRTCGASSSATAIIAGPVDLPL